MVTVTVLLKVVALVLAAWSVVEGPKSKLAWAVLILAVLLVAPVVVVAR